MVQSPLLVRLKRSIKPGLRTAHRRAHVTATTSGVRANEPSAAQQWCARVVARAAMRRTQQQRGGAGHIWRSDLVALPAAGYSPSGYSLPDIRISFAPLKRASGRWRNIFFFLTALLSQREVYGENTSDARFESNFQKQGAPNVALAWHRHRVHLGEMFVNCYPCIQYHCSRGSAILSLLSYLPVLHKRARMERVP